MRVRVVTVAAVGSQAAGASALSIIVYVNAGYYDGYSSSGCTSYTCTDLRDSCFRTWAKVAHCQFFSKLLGKGQSSLHWKAFVWWKVSHRCRGRIMRPIQASDLQKRDELTKSDEVYTMILPRSRCCLFTISWSA